MREWNLGPGDPLELTLSADFRLCTPDFINDHIWELVLGGGEPPALALRTTYGLRARSMRIFPRFTIAGQTVCDPAVFFSAPRLRRFHPNSLMLQFSPFEAIDVTAEYWVPGSHACAGRFSFTNRGEASISFLLELCIQLVPLEEGRAMAPLPMESINILSGQTADLAPVIFMTGGPQPGAGPYPSLTASRTLEPGETRTLTWAEAALGTAKESLELARLTAAQPWEAARARMDLLNAAQTVEIFTGDPDWDAALALSQKTALRLFFGPGGNMPHPFFVGARQPDHGYSLRGDGSDYPPAWAGATPLEALTLAGMLPGASQWPAGVLRNFLASQAADGWVSGKIGPVNPAGRWLAAPLLAGLAWQIYSHLQDPAFLREVYPGLSAFVESWFTPLHDRDGDGFPEWDHLLQTGLEDTPAFSVWQVGGQGAQASAVESPALAAMLVHELNCLSSMAEALGRPEEQSRWAARVEQLSRLTEECWDSRAGAYHYRDRDSHLSPAGKVIGKLRGPGSRTFEKPFKGPVRLLARLDLRGQATRRLTVTLSGQNGEIHQTEVLERADFQWGAGLAVATSRSLYTSLAEISVAGIEKRDRLTILAMDTASEDVSLFLPLWAGIPGPERAARLSQALLAPDRFGKPFGVPACPVFAFSPDRQVPPETQVEMDRAGMAVHLPWNALLVEGLLQVGLQAEAAQLFYRLMSAVIRSLKKQQTFAFAYHAATGEGLGERGSLQGLAPVGLFLRLLGVQVLSPRRVKLCGKNLYPWPVTVKYRGLTITRQADQTVVTFPDGQSLTLPDPTDAIVSID